MSTIFASKIHDKLRAYGYKGQGLYDMYKFLLTEHFSYLSIVEQLTPHQAHDAKNQDLNRMMFGDDVESVRFSETVEELKT